MTFETITNDDIIYVEKYTSTDLPDILKQNLGECEKGAEKEIMSMFFGIYFFQPTKFLFSIGEKRLVQLCVSYVKSKANFEGDDQSQRMLYFKADGVKLKPKDLMGTPIGSFFFDINNRSNVLATKRPNTLETGTISPEEMQEILFGKVKKVISSYKVQTAINNFTMNMVEIGICDNGDINAHVKCVFCEKSKTKVFCRQTKYACSFILSNLKKHYENCSKLKDVNNCTTTIGLEISRVDNVMENDVQSDSILSNCMSDLQLQITLQSVKMSNLMVLNNEIESDCRFFMGSSPDEYLVKICEIYPDGSCLFSAIAHQIFHKKLTSDHHHQVTKKLRSEVAEYIKDKLSHFETELKGRLYELNHGKKIFDFKKESEVFLLERLSTGISWGGIETIKAIGMMYKVNIIVFDEYGQCRLPNKFEPDFEKSIMLAYRLAETRPHQIVSNSERNHYDSVVGVDAGLVLPCIKNLISAEMKRIGVNIQDEIFEIDSSQES